MEFLTYQRIQMLTNYNGCISDSRGSKKPCERDACRHWMDYSDDLNCSIIAAEDHGPMTLEDISKRMGVTLVQIKNIQDRAMDKMKKRMTPTLHE